MNKAGLLCVLVPAAISDIKSTMTRKHIIEAPWEMRGAMPALGAKWDSKHKQFIYEGESLPPLLAPFATPDFSWGRWLEDDLNKSVKPVKMSDRPFTPREHQLVAAKKITGFAKRGGRGFAVADETGLGKTIATIYGAYGASKIRGFSEKRKAKVLIVCPKSVIPHWRQSLASSPLPSVARIAVINYEQLAKLLVAPASAAKAKTARTKNKRIASSGTPLVDWDVIIADESHKLKNAYTSQRAKAFASVAKYGASPKDGLPFVIFVSATLAQTPLEAAYLAPLFTNSAGKPLSLKTWGPWLASQGFAVKEGKGGSWTWAQVHWKANEIVKADNEKAKAADIKKLRGMLFGPGCPSIRRNPSDLRGWPEVQTIPVPVALDASQRSLYEEIWTQFRSFLQLHARGRDPKGGLAQQLRFRQKSSLVRVPGTVDFVKDLLDEGHQVAVSVEFMESLDLMRTGLEKAGVECAEYSGRNPDERESERLRFQRGEASVIFFTPVEGFSLHASEQLADGTKASATPRATVVHDVRYSAITNLQICGRTHRDGQFSNIYFMFGEDTVEEKILLVMLERMKNLRTLSGDDMSAIQEIEDLLVQLAQS